MTGAEARVGIERLLDRTIDIRNSESKHGPANDRRYKYIPTYILRGLTNLHLELESTKDCGRSAVLPAVTDEHGVE